MRKIGTTSATVSLNKKSSVKKRNITLRRLISGLRHDAMPDDNLMPAVAELFADVKNAVGCEKYFGEAIELMSLCANRELRDMAGRFPVNGLAD